MNSIPSSQNFGAAASIASFCSLPSPLEEPRGYVVQEGSRRWFSIEGVEAMPPFLMSLVSDSDHWLFMLSNGAFTAGRINPDHALLPYYTQDKIQDMANASGNQTLIMVEHDGREHLWEPFKPTWNRSAAISRRLSKNDLGSHIKLEEIHHELGLMVSMSWRPSGRFGFVRKMELLNLLPAKRSVRILDGLRNILPAGIGQRFQNEFSILGDAYKQSEFLEQSRMGIYHLSSRPTDLAEPMEALIANVAWQTGLPTETFLINETGQEAFIKGESQPTQTTSRGRRGAHLSIARLELESGTPVSWYTCADIEKDAADVQALSNEITQAGPAITAAIEQDCEQTEAGLCKMLSAADGFQWTAAANRTLRHTSNTTFNLMRGGAFVTGYELPKHDLLASVKKFNQQAAEALEELFQREPVTEVDQVWSSDAVNALPKDAKRLLREYLPLTFSRRHGDPSRPWNRFSIDIKDADGNPRFAYQGNWRDIFQNWEALLMSYPSYTEATILRFLNASTADGYNPYRLTKDGFEWEVLEPGDDWANIGYWGDHQIIYLLRLLEVSNAFHPGRLSSCLDEDAGVYAQIPYRLRAFEDMLKDTRETVDYDTRWADRLETAVQTHGSDGKLLRDGEDEILYVSLLEKLLVPLLGKLANFIPSGGIWMNTQRPEWNDANNALVGNGISVVTTGYIARYLRFLIDLLEATPSLQAPLSVEVASLMDSQKEIFAAFAPAMDETQRLAFMRAMGTSASDYRQGLYDSGLSGQRRNVSAQHVIDYLQAALTHVTTCLVENRRPDGLWHSYNLLRTTEAGASVERLFVMLEGQVSILSAGILSTAEALDLLKALRASPLYREDQDSYILYPDRKLPDFLNKNKISAERVKEAGLPSRLLEKTSGILSPLPDGNFAFNGAFRNQRDLLKALQTTDEVSENQRQILIDIFEETFHHHAFTGRSGTFFAYEGLGSIYWHMVSKLVLAVQELIGDSSASDAQIAELIGFYRALRDGIGVNKSPAVYGAFPTDAYSHTPGHCGAQQPGMTGQVKEDVLIRLREMGICIEKGQLRFQANLIEDLEFHKSAQTVLHQDLLGETIELNIPQDGLAFTFCQIPVICVRSPKAAIQVHSKNGSVQAVEGHSLSNEISDKIFRRTGEISQLVVEIPA